MGFISIGKTIRDNLYGVQVWGFKTSGGRFKTSGLNTLDSDGEIPRIATCHLGKALSLEMSKSGFSDLITSPHRASGVGAILLFRTLLCSKPSVFTGSRAFRVQRAGSRRSVIPWTEHGSPSSYLGGLKDHSLFCVRSRSLQTHLESEDDDGFGRGASVAACACVQLRACAGTGCDCTFP